MPQKYKIELQQVEFNLEKLFGADGSAALFSLVPRGNLRLDGCVAGDAHTNIGADIGRVADIPCAALIGDGRSRAREGFWEGDCSTFVTGILKQHHVETEEVVN